MSRAYSAGTYALQICDRCGRRVKYGELKNEVVNKRRTDFLVCDECFDVDHPQWRVGRVRVDDPQSLRDPKPEPYEISRGMFGWNPAGPVSITIQIGTVEG
jgi:hypothetical protein